MKPDPCPPAGNRPWPRGACRWLACAGLAPLALAAAPAPKPPPAAAEPKTHTLFMGTEISIQRGGKFYRVEDVSGSSFRVRVGREDVFVPTRLQSNNLRFDHVLRLTAASVTLGKLKGERTYTSGNDPRRKFDAAAGAAGGAAATVDVSNAQMQQAAESLSWAQNSPYAPPAEQMERLENNAAATTEQNLQSQALVGADQNIAGTHEGRMRGELADGNYDAMEIAFEISAPAPLDDPYMLIIARFRERGTKPGVSRNWIFAQAIDPVDARPRQVRVREGGFPPGFVLEDYQVHIYNRGTEVATNASAKRVELTRAEARQYLAIEHMAAHKGATLPPAPLPGGLADGPRAALSAAQLDRACHVRVGADGEVLGVFADAAGRQPVDDAAVANAFKEVFFTPALDQGKPVAGLVRVRLADLPR